VRISGAETIKNAAGFRGNMAIQTANGAKTTGGLDFLVDHYSISGYFYIIRTGEFPIGSGKQQTIVLVNEEYNPSMPNLVHDNPEAARAVHAIFAEIMEGPQMKTPENVARAYARVANTCLLYQS